MAHRFGESTGPAWMAKRVRLSLVAVLLGLLAVSVGLALSGNWLVSAQSNDFDAEAEDIWTLGIVTGQTADISARFQNLSPSTGPHGGEATFDVTIYVEPPTGTATRFSWDNEVFTLDQRRTFSRSYTFASAGTYTVLAEIYDINGQQSGWNADNRFDQQSRPPVRPTNNSPTFPVEAATVFAGSSGGSTPVIDDNYSAGASRLFRKRGRKGYLGPNRWSTCLPG